MRNYESEMLVYIQLAKLADTKQQTIGRNRFLVLAGAAACFAGYLEIAELCRVIVQQSNPLHVLVRFESFPVALRDDEFSHFYHQLEKNCKFERAEYLLSQALSVTSLTVDTDTDTPNQVLNILQSMIQSAT